MKKVGVCSFCIKVLFPFIANSSNNSGHRAEKLYHFMLQMSFIIGALTNMYWNQLLYCDLLFLNEYFFRRFFRYILR